MTRSVVGGDELRDVGDDLGGVDDHSGAVERGVSPTIRVEIASGLVTSRRAGRAGASQCLSRGVGCMCVLSAL